MQAFRAFLLVFFLLIAGYTFIVGFNHGWDLLSVFLTDLTSLTWPGQFDLDFWGYLLLSGLWVAWRHRFSPRGLALGGLASVAGTLFFMPYLIWLTLETKGDMAKLLMGERARELR